MNTKDTFPHAACLGRRLPCEDARDGGKSLLCQFRVTLCKGWVKKQTGDGSEWRAVFQLTCLPCLFDPNVRWKESARREGGYLGWHEQLLTEKQDPLITIATLVLPTLVHVSVYSLFVQSSSCWTKSGYAAVSVLRLKMSRCRMNIETYIQTTKKNGSHPPSFCHEWTVFT